ncbi:MAG: hypothetical protein COA83_06130 [Methylophaga sp.]|nr:MAG: hypothetical protein COA83_06130 [Methylophaga sp.]
MLTLKIKLCELNNGDIGSFKSMFHLTASQRKHDWEIVLSGAADLYIYSFESEKSITAWQNHSSSDGMSVLFSTNLDVDVAVDIVLKKPLRTKNLSEMLNSAAKQIHLSTRLKNHSPEEIALQDIYATESTETEALVKEKGSILSSISKRLTRKQSSHRDLPTINLSLPEQTEIQSDLILDSIELKQTLQLLLAGRDDDALVSSILSNLIPLNRFIIPSKTRQILLEIYRQSTFQLMRSWEARVNILEGLSQDDYLKSIQALALLIDELAIGYKILLVEAYDQGSHPKSKEPFLLAINRVAEYSSLTILHSYCFLRNTQAASINTLHQLYLCCESAKVLDTKVSTKDDRASLSFSSIYKQIILTSIADPFRLTKVDVLKLYRLMAKYTQKITIDVPSEDQKQPRKDTLMGGLFCLDLASNTLPISLDRIKSEERSLPNIRILNTHSALTAIERIFHLAASSLDDAVYSSEIQLLKKVIPHLNNSYERQFKRIQSADNIKIKLIKDLEYIQNALYINSDDIGNDWNIHNRGLGGMMLSNKNIPYSHLDVGDFYGVFEADKSASLALVRWLRVTDNGVEMGLELLHGEPLAIHFFLENEPEQIPALLLRNKKQADTLIAPKGLLNIDEAIELTENDKTYIISIDTLIDNSFNYDHFSFTTI